MIARSKNEGKDKTRKSSGTATDLSEANSGAMAPGSGTQAAVVAGAMMEEGLGTGSVNGHGQGKLWSLDQNMDKPLGLEADRVHSMQYRKVREHS
jgi:saccharopine dehydrogenase-like NADP-dependent oxidoreductase